VGFTVYLGAVCVDFQHHKTLMGNRISEEKHSWGWFGSSAEVYGGV